MKKQITALAVCLLTVPVMFAQEMPKRLKVISTTVTTNFIPKYTNGSGAMADSAVSEVGGLVGIGTNNPQGNLHLFGGATNDVFAAIGPDPVNGPAMNYGYAGSSFGRGAGFFNVRPDGSAVAPNPSLRFATANVVRLIITNVGKVGIGTTPATASPNMLEVAGSANFTGAVTANNIAATYQDLAEWVPASSDLTAATVVVLNPEKRNEVMQSTHAYDAAVAGVVSPQPGLILGRYADGSEKIATTGRVKVRVDARRLPVRIGDLLVTSDLPGAAMRSEPIAINGRSFHQPGTIIGKALEPLDSGVGEILVLLSLQ